MKQLDRRTISRAFRGASSDPLLLPSWMLALLLLGSVLPIGSVHTPWLIALALTSSGALWILRRETARPPWFVAWCAVLAAFCVVQIVPLPEWLVGALSPRALELWQAVPWLGAPPAPRLSLDTSATRIEALRWLVYPVALWLACTVGRERPERVPKLVFGSALVVALVTLGHGLLGAREVYGLYHPTFEPPRWGMSPLLNSNNLAGYLNLGLFAGLGWLVSSRHTEERWLVALGVALLVGGSILCGSRGGLGTLVLGAVALPWVLPRRKGGPRLEPALVVALVGGAAIAITGAQTNTWLALRDESLEKLELARESLRLIRDFAWVGTGAGGFETVFPSYRVAIGSWGRWAHPENFVLGWLADFGVPLGLATLASLSITLRPAMVRRRRMDRALLVGIVVFAVQNLVDVAFTVPGALLGWFVAIGGVWGAARGEQPPDARPLPRRFGVTVLALQAAAVVALSVTATPTAHEDRRAIAELTRNSDVFDRLARRRIESTVDQALARHPADPYLLTAGATTALSHDPRLALVWAARALERDERNAFVQLLIAEVLHRLAHDQQALLHLRKAAEFEPVHAAQAAAWALAWAPDEPTLLRTLPPGSGEATMAYEIAIRLEPARAALRKDLLRRALRRQPDFTAARYALARQLLDELDIPDTSCHADVEGCLQTLTGLANALRESEGGQDAASIVRARVEERRNNLDGAVDGLERDCTRADPSCLQLWVIFACRLGEARCETAVRAYAAAYCDTPEACSGTQEWLGDRYSERGAHERAYQRYELSAEAQPHESAWRKAAQSARSLGRTDWAARAESQAQGLASGGH
ncbi:MAG TPA: O-antigen ligase family protein [Polyangiaceae bacterium]|nr:O-antigen ligase family protein [Polyangiaceae bacterium]